MSNLAFHTTDPVASVVTSACEAAVSNMPLSLKRVDNDGNVSTMATYSYFVVARICGPKHLVHGVRISYTR